jgi:hypothetical protein
MAIYVAELIIAARQAKAADKRAAQERCSAVILELWEYRSKWPDRARPFKELEPIISTLEGLRPEAKNPFYQQYFWERAEHKVENEQLKKWLQLAQGLDYTARLLVEYAIDKAVRVSIAESISWVKEAVEAEVASGSDVELSAELLTWVSEPGRDLERRKKTVSDRLSRLDAFLEMAGEIGTELRAELEEMSQDPS